MLSDLLHLIKTRVHLRDKFDVFWDIGFLFPLSLSLSGDALSPCRLIKNTLGFFPLATARRFQRLRRLCWSCRECAGW